MVDPGEYLRQDAQELQQLNGHGGLGERNRERRSSHAEESDIIRGWASQDCGSSTCSMGKSENCEEERLNIENCLVSRT